MLNATWRILLVDDDEDDYFLTREMLAESRRDRFILEWAPTIQSARQVLAADRFDAVLVDYDLGLQTGITLIREVVDRGDPSPIILLTARGSYEVDVEAMQAGAADYLNKSEVNAALLERTIRYAIERRQAEEAVRISEESPNPVMRIFRDGTLLYANPASQPLLEGMGCKPGQAVPLEWQEHVSDVLERGEKQELEIQTGERIYACLLVPVVQARYANLYGTDVTEREQLILINEQQKRELEIHQAELERSREELVRQNMLLDQVVQNSPVNILLLEGPEHRYALYNSVHRIYAMGRGELLGRSIVEVWPDFSEAVSYLDRVYQTGQGWTGIDTPVEIQRENGLEVLYLTISMAPLRNEEGLVDRILVIGIDTTDQVRMRHHLDAEQARMRAIIENAPEGILVADNDLKIIICNPAAEVFLGETAQVGKAFTFEPSPLRHPSGEHYIPADLPLTRSIREGLTFRDVEMTVNTNQSDSEDGFSTLLVNTAPIYDMKGQITGGVAVLRDITELKRAREWLESELDERRRVQSALVTINDALASTNRALRESEGRFRVALAGAPVTVFTMNRDLKFTWIYNPPLYLTSGDVIGKREDELPGIEDIDELLAVKRQVIETGRRTQREVRVRAGGAERYYVITAEPLLDAAGTVAGLTGAKMDITNQRQLEARQLEYAAQMEVQRRLLQQREMERTQIARDLHDGPIQELISLMFSIQIAHRMSEDEGLKELLAQVREQVQQMVTDLRGVCNELRPPTLVKFGLEKAIRSHAEEFQNKYSQLQIQMDLMEDRLSEGQSEEAENGSNDQVRLALFRIYQECMNNIIRHANARQVNIRLQKDDVNLYLEVQDDGNGFDLPADWVELARQGHLGLVGIRERAEAVGGLVEFNSKPGEGTRVRLNLPLTAL